MVNAWDHSYSSHSEGMFLLIVCQYNVTISLFFLNWGGKCEMPGGTYTPPWVSVLCAVQFMIVRSET